MAAWRCCKRGDWPCRETVLRARPASSGAFRRRRGVPAASLGRYPDDETLDQDRQAGADHPMSDIAERVKKIVVEHLGVEESKVTPEASFIDDLGADSLDTVELVMAFEEAFSVEIPEDAAEKISTVQGRDRLYRKAEGGLIGRAGGLRHGWAGQGWQRCAAWSSQAWASSVRSALGVEHVWRRLIAGESGIGADPVLRRRATCPARSPARCRPAPGRTASSTSPSGSRSRTRRRWTASSTSPWSAATEAVEDSGWQPDGRGGPLRHRRDDRLRHRRAGDDLRGVAAGA